MRVKELIDLLERFNEEEFVFLTIDDERIISIRSVYKDDDGDVILGS